MVVSQPWSAPAADGPLDALVRLPGSKSLTARALLLSAIASDVTELDGVLRSRDTDLMLQALATLGVHSQNNDTDPTRVCITPGSLPLQVTSAADTPVRIECGLAGTVMRFIPPLLALADKPVLLDGDDAARRRPLAPLLDALTQLGTTVRYVGEPGFLPVVLTPGVLSADTEVEIDASLSSQFLSALLLTGCVFPGGLRVRAVGEIPSLPHVEMTVECVRQRGIAVVDLPTPPSHNDAPPESRSRSSARGWRVAEGRPTGGRISIEPDLSNAGPFLAAALVAGGSVRVPSWPLTTTQAGDAWRTLLPAMGGHVTTHVDPDATAGTATLTVTGTGDLRGLEADLSHVGELVPTLAALAVLASERGHASRFTGIAHLRGHETNRLAALVAEITRLGGRAEETPDGLRIDPLPHGTHLHPACLRAYADHRMATFAAIVGLGVPGVTLDDVGCTSKTLPDFPSMWAAMLRGQKDAHGTS